MSTRRLHISEGARRGIVDISVYLEAEFGSVVEARALERIYAAMEMLHEHPNIGHPRHDLSRREGIRFWSVGPTLIAYHFDTKMVEILAVDRADRDWKTRFDVSGE